MEEPTQLDRIEANLQRIERMLQGKLKPEEWISKTEALKLLGCERTKLQELVLSGKVQVNSNPKKGLRLKYSRTSIEKYKSGQ